MIAALHTGNQEQFFRLAAADPFLGCQMEVDARLFGHCDHLMRFFVCEQGALEIKGDTAYLAGAADGAELAGMLAFAGVRRIVTAGPLPLGWRESGQMAAMEYRLGIPPALPAGITLDTAPPAADLLQVVACEGITGPGADNFYSEVCTKRNHGMGQFWLARLDGQPAATAGCYALTHTRAYLAGVVTLPQYRRQGIGGGLCAALAAHLAAQGRTVGLLCRPEREPFYQKLGFVRQGLLHCGRP